MSQQPNWLGLLKWSLAYSDGTAPSMHTTMSVEDRKWLEAVMKEGVRDEPARLNELMLQLQDILSREISESDKEVIDNALEDIKEIIDQIDMAHVFTKFGGVKCLLALLNNDHLSNESKALAASVIGTISQNNLIVQDMLFRDGLMKDLMAIYERSESSLLCAKILYSVSCTVRSHAALEGQFMQSFARSALTKAFSSSDEGLVLRAVFLSNALLTSDYTSIHRIQVLTDLIVPAIFSRFSSMNIDLHENALRLLTSLLHTGYGYQLLTTSAHNASLEAALVGRVEFLRNEVSAGSMTEEEFRYNTSLMNELRELLSHPVAVRYPANTSSNSPRSPLLTVSNPRLPIHRNTTTSSRNSDDIKKASAAAATAVPATVLMIGAPSSASTTNNNISPATN